MYEYADQREQVLAEIVALRLARLPEIAAFREEVLGDKLLKPEEVEPWINDHDDWAGDKGKMLDFRYVVWLGQDDVDMWGFPVDPESLLGRLHLLAKDVVENHCPGWAIDQAVAYILCGQYPGLSRYTVEMVKSVFTPAASARVKMVVDPRVSIKELSEIYARSRNRLLGIEGSASSRPRPMSEKHLKLALFTEKNRGTGTWDELRKKWNKGQKKEWRYGEGDTWNFARAAKVAWERVTGDKFDSEKLQNKGRVGEPDGSE